MIACEVFLGEECNKQAAFRSFVRVDGEYRKSCKTQYYFAVSPAPERRNTEHEARDGE